MWGGVGSCGLDIGGNGDQFSSNDFARLAKHVSRNVAPRTSLGTETSTESGTTVFRAGDRTITFDASVSPIQRSAILKSLIKRRPTGTRGETMVTKGASIEAGSL